MANATFSANASPDPDDALGLLAQHDLTLRDAAREIARRRPRDETIRCICRGRFRATFKGVQLAVGTDQALYLATSLGKDRVRRLEWRNIQDITTANDRYYGESNHPHPALVTRDETIIWPHLSFDDQFTPPLDLFQLAILNVIPKDDPRTKLWIAWLEQNPDATYTHVAWPLIQALAERFDAPNEHQVIAFGLHNWSACLLTEGHLIIADGLRPPLPKKTGTATFRKTRYIRRDEITSVELSYEQTLNISTADGTASALLHTPAAQQLLKALL